MSQNQMNKTIIILTISILLFSYSLNADEERMVTTTLDKVVELEVLKERLTGIEKQTNIQLIALEKRTNLYFTIIGVVFAIVSFLGYKTITNWIRSTIEDKADDEIKKHITHEYVNEIISKNITAELVSKIVIENSKDAIDDAVNKTVSNLDAKAKEKLSELDSRLAVFENLENVYATSLAELKKETIDINKEVTKETTKKLEQFEQKIAQVKTEENYSIDDWYFKGVSEYGKKEYKNAIKSLNKAIELDSENVSCLIGRAGAYGNLKQYNKAIEDCNKTIALDPKHTIAYYNRGKAYSGLKQHNKAIEDYNKAIALDPKYTVTYINRGNEYFDLKQHNKAIEDYNKAIALDPKYTIAYSNRGAVYGNLKQYNNAIDDCNKAITLDPKDVHAYLNISEFKIITDNYKSALGFITKGLLLHPGTEHKAILIYLECITKKLLNVDTFEIETAFNEILKKDFTITWDFETMESWLKDANIKDDTKRYIREKIELLKKHL